LILYKLKEHKETLKDKEEEYREEISGITKEIKLLERHIFLLPTLKRRVSEKVS